MPSFHLDPFLQKSASVKSFLTRVAVSEEEQAHPFVDDAGKRFLLRVSKEDNGAISFEQEDISPGEERQFIDGVSVNEAAAQVVKNMGKYRAQLGTICDYEVSVLAPGKSITVPFSADTIQLFCVTEKKGQYFDFVLHAKNQENVWRTTNYSNRTQPGTGIIHSGDIGGLLHHAKLQNAFQNNQVALLNVVGFRKTPLQQFANQLPTVLVADHEARIVHLVPCPLDARTIADKTMAALCGIRRSRGVLEVHALAAPEGLAGVDTCDMNPAIEAMAEKAAATSQATLDVARTRAEAQALREAQTNVEAGNATIQDAFALLAAGANGNEEEPEPTEEAGAGAGADDVCAPLPGVSTFLLVEARLDCKAIVKGSYMEDEDTMVVVTSGSGIAQVRAHDALAVIQQDPSGVDLPLGFCGCLEGSPSLALGTPARGFPQGTTSKNFVNMLDNAGILVAHLTGQGMERTLSDAKHRANAVFILHHALPASTEVSEESFNNVEITGFTSRRGPCATLLLQSSDGRRFFYSAGSTIPGLMDRLSEFGEDVTEIFTDERIKAVGKGFKSGEAQKPFPNLVSRNLLEKPIGERPIVLGNQELTIAGLEAYLSKLTVRDLRAEESFEIDHIRCALTQVSAMLSTSELKPTRERLTKSLQAIVESYMAPFKAKRSQIVKKVSAVLNETGRDSQAFVDTSKDLKQLKAEMKAASRFAGRVLKPLVAQVAGLVSVQRSSNRKLDLARVAKLDQMRSNRDAIEQMDWETLSDRLCELCGEAGFVFATVDPPKNRQLLENVIGGSFISDALIQSSTGLVSFDPRHSGSVDSWTAMALNEVTQGRAHDLAGPYTCFTIPVEDVSEGDVTQASQVGFPLLNMDIELKDAGDVFWPSTPEGEGGCNDPDRTLARYVVRQVFIESDRARSLNMTAHAGSVELTYYCAHTILSAMERLISLFGENGYPSEPGSSSSLWNDTTRMILRGLSGLFLSFVASGADPASNIWCVVQRGSKMPLPKAGQGEWALLARFIHAFPHTCWPTRTVVKNSQALMTRVTKAVADTFLQPMRDALTETKKQEMVDYVNTRNYELEIAFWAASLVRSGREARPPLEATKRVLNVILCMYAKGKGATEGENMLKQVSRRKTPGFVRLLDGLVQYVRDCEVAEEKWETVKVVAENIWKRRNDRAAETGNTIWRVHAGKPDLTVKEQNAVISAWKAEFRRIYDGTAPDKTLDAGGPAAALVDSGADTPSKSPLMLAISGKPGSERGALAVAQLLESRGPISVNGILDACQRAGRSAATVSIHTESVCSILRFLGYQTEESQGRVVGEILKTFMLMWRSNSDDTWAAAMRVWDQHEEPQAKRAKTEE